MIRKYFPKNYIAQSFNIYFHTPYIQEESIPSQPVVVGGVGKHAAKRAVVWVGRKPLFSKYDCSSNIYTIQQDSGRRGEAAGKRGRRGCMINGPVTGPKSLPADLRDIYIYRYIYNGGVGSWETETLDRRTTTGDAVISKARKAFSYYNPLPKRSCVLFDLSCVRVAPMRPPLFFCVSILLFGAFLRILLIYCSFMNYVFWSGLEKRFSMGGLKNYFDPFPWCYHTITI